MTRSAIVVIPTLNEERRIGGLLAQLSRTSDTLVREILVADGGSTDLTRAHIAAAAAQDGRIRMIDNPERLQAGGINRAVGAAGPDGDTIVRIDAHALYPDDYLAQILARFGETGADMVAVRLLTRGETCLQRGIAAASNSRTGTGGSAHRIGGRSGFVEHGHHAGIDRRLFEDIGGYDATFAANEDAEFDVRARRAGGHIWLAGEIEVIYFPRRSLRALFTQYRRYGRGRARTFLKHREPLRLRQMLPPLLVLGLFGTTVLSPWQPLLLVVPLLYAAALAGAAGRLVPDAGPCALAAAPASATMHIAWGWGFLVTITAHLGDLVRPPLSKRGESAIVSPDDLRRGR